MWASHRSECRRTWCKRRSPFRVEICSIGDQSLVPGYADRLRFLCHGRRPQDQSRHDGTTALTRLTSAALRIFPIVSFHHQPGVARRAR